MNGEELRHAREALGLSQLELAAILGITDRVIRNNESGRVKVSAERAMLIGMIGARAFNLTPHNLINELLAPMNQNGRQGICMSEHYRQARPLMHTYLFTCDSGLDVIEADVLTMKIASHQKVVERVKDFSEVEAWRIAIEASGSPRIG